MRVVVVLGLVFVCGVLQAQDPWKNIYSHQAWAERDRWQKADELIALLKISAGCRVADIGCHEGYMTFKLAKVVGSTGLVYAVDVAEEKLAKVAQRATQNNLDQIKVIKGNDNDPKLPSNSLDAVIILDTYHEMDQHQEILQHIRAALRKGGRLLLCEPIADERRKLPRAEQEKKHELGMEHALRDVEDAGLRVHFQKDNYIDRTREKGDKMWVVVAVKD